MRAALSFPLPWRPAGSGGVFWGAHTQPWGAEPEQTPQQPPCSASPYLTGALPRLGFEQMALEIQEADGDLVQRGGMLEPQVTLPQLSYRHPKERGGLGLQQPSPCPRGRGSLEPNMVLPGKGASVCHLLGSSQGWDKLRLPRAARGSGTQRRVVQAHSPAIHLIQVQPRKPLCRAGAHQAVLRLAWLSPRCPCLGRRHMAPFTGVEAVLQNTCS